MKETGLWRWTNRGSLRAKVVITAGVWADMWQALPRPVLHHPRPQGDHCHSGQEDPSPAEGRPPYPLNSKAHAKGGGLNPTVEGNPLGPNAGSAPTGRLVHGPEDIEFRSPGTCPQYPAPAGDVITYFAGAGLHL